MKPVKDKYNVITVLPEISANHPYAHLVVIYDKEKKQLFTSNTCDVHIRLAPWDGGEDSQYTHDEIMERLLMMHNSRMLQNVRP